MSGDDKEEIDELTVNVDYILKEYTKPIGPWQLCTTILTGFTALQSVFNKVFFLGNTEYRCQSDKSTENILSQYSFEQASMAVGPSIYHGTGQFTQKQMGCYQFSQFNNSASELIKCKNGYVHYVSDLYYPDTLVKKWDLVCDYKWMVPFESTAYMLGMFLGYVIGGQISDKIGRRRSTIIMAFLQMLFLGGTSLSVNYTMFAVMRFAQAFTFTACMTASFVLVNELTLSRYRSLNTAIMYTITGFVSKMFIVLCAYLIPQWRLFNLASCAFISFAFMFPFVIPESPRWLLSQNRPKEALYQLYQGYRMNLFFGLCNKQSPEEIDKTCQYFFSKAGYVSMYENKSLLSKVLLFARKPYLDKCDTKINTSSKGFFSGLKKTFGSKKTAVKSIKCILIFTCQIIVYFGLTLYVRFIKGSIYFTSSIQCTTAVPSTLLSFLLYNCIKSRRSPLIGLYSLTAVVLFASGMTIIFSSAYVEPVLIAGACISYLLVSSTQNMMMLYIAELFPSDVRSQGLGNSTGFARIGGTLCDFINELDSTYLHGLPLLIYAGLAVLTIILILSLEDTTGDNLKDTSTT